MIACVRAVAPPEPALRALRMELDARSPRVQLLYEAGATELLLDMGRGTAAEARGHGAVLAELAAGLGVGAAIGLAPAPTLARLAARAAEPGAALAAGPRAVPALLARCPVTWLPPFAPFAPALHGLGLRSLGAVAALPPDAVGGRFGGEALRSWRALHGDEPPLTPVPHPPRMRAVRRFDGPVADGETLGLALERMAARVAAALERRGAQARALALHLHGDGGPYAASCVLAHPAAGSATLAPLAAALLAAAAPMAGVETAELIVGELLPLRGEQLALFAASGPRDEARAALDDLVARLGPARLLRASLAPPGLAPAEARGRFEPWTSP